MKNTHLFAVLFIWGCASTFNIPEPTRESAKIYADEELRIEEGIEYHGKGEFDKAVAIYEEILERNPDNVLAMYEISYSLFEKGDYKRSLGFAKRAMEYNTEYLPMLYVMVGNSLDHMGKPKRAVSVYHEGIEKYPRSFMLHYNLGITYFGMKKLTEAESASINAIRTNTRHSSSHILLAEIYQQRGEQIPALLLLCRFLTLEPATPRSRAAIRDIENLLQWGVHRKDEKNVNINLFGFNEFSPYSSMEIMLRLWQAALTGELREIKSAIEIRVDTFKMLFKSISEKADKTHGDFTADYLFPYYSDLHKNELSETFVYFIYQSAENPEIKVWLESNEEKIMRFIEWNKQFD